MSLPTTKSLRFRSPIAVPPTVGFALACGLAAVLAIIAPTAAAALYKWTDANGRVVYSDQPPTGNVKVEAINAPPPPANPNAAKDLADKEAELAQKKLVRADEDAKAAKARADTAQMREQCARVHGQIAMLQPEQNQQVLMFRANEKGEPVYMDDGARRRERERLEVWVRENCST
jgi:Skp family chaperone for outer membrane proteins